MLSKTQEIQHGDEEEDYLTEKDGFAFQFKTARKKELARFPRDFIEKRETIRAIRSDQGEVFDFIDTWGTEHNRRLALLSGRVDSLQVGITDIHAAIKTLNQNIEKIARMAPSGSQGIKGMANIPWKKISHVENALAALKKHLLKSIEDRFPNKITFWITPILMDLFSDTFAGRVRFSTSQRERKTKNFVRMGIYCPVLPVSFTSFARELIASNPTLKNPTAEFKCIKNFFNNRNRCMRKLEIKNNIDLALDQKQGMKSRAACLLIANDLSESVGGITQPISPSRNTESDLSAWVDNFWKPVLTTIAKKKLKKPPETILNETHRNIIQMCLDKKGSMTIEDLRDYGGDKKGDENEMEDCYNAGDTSGDDDDDEHDNGMAEWM